MSYQVDDSRRLDHARHIQSDQPSDTKWIIGGFVALVLVIGGLFMFSDKNATVASNTGAGNPTMTAPANRPAPTPAR